MSERWGELIAAAHAFASLAMTGLVWFVQVVHYPLFARVQGDFAAYETSHQSRTTLVVGPLMLTEAATAAALLALPVAGVDRRMAALSLGLVAVAWGLTFLVSVPLHGKLSGGFDAAAHACLVATNWPRTAVWTARGVLSLLLFRQAVMGRAL